MFEFSSFPKIPRLNRGMIITEKIDGTNACVKIFELRREGDYHDLLAAGGVTVTTDDAQYGVSAQSRNRNITPLSDNYGFAGWVARNAETLVADLGEGYHFGEWWGNGIQRGYGLNHKRFSLFNTKRWGDVGFQTPGVYCVPELYSGEFDVQAIRDVVGDLLVNGSVAAPGYHNAEGVVIYLPAAHASFKVMCIDDDKSKTEVEALLDEHSPEPLESALAKLGKPLAA